MKTLPLFCLLLVLFSACAKHDFKAPEPVKVTETEPLEEIRMPQAQQKTAGSLWANDATSIFSDFKA